MNELVYLWAGLAIGLAWVWVALWQSSLTHTSMVTMGKNPQLAGFLLIVTILWVALVESAAIYGLVVAFSILWSETISGMAAIWAWLSIWITGFGAGLWEGKLISGAMEAMNRNPENKNKIMAFMVLFAALIEVIAIYGLIIAFKIIGG